MSWKNWIRDQSRTIRDERYPVFKDSYDKVGLFWTLPRFARSILLLVLAIAILIAGVISFFTGMNTAVLVFSYWSDNLSIYGLLGISGACRVWIALSSFLLSLTALLSLVIWSWSRSLNGQADMERRMRNEARFSDEDWFTRALWILINRQLNFFGKPYPGIHVLIFFISIVAFFVKG